MPPDQDVRKRHARYEHMKEQLIEIEARIARLESILADIKKKEEN